MKTTATITFHAAHNYGSMLQAYALQNIIQGLNCDNIIINLRTNNQKSIYRHPTDNKNASWKAKYIGPIVKLPFRNVLIRKYEKYENFLDKDLCTSNEMTTITEVSDYCKKKQFDYLIAGSDQIWNTACSDFDWSYFLPFTTGNAISYAASMGPKGGEQVLEINYNKIKEYLHKFRAISVREEGTAKVVKSITDKMPDILVDPTFLLSKTDWERIDKIPVQPIVSGEYIFLYSPAFNQSAYLIAQKVSKQLRLPVVVSNMHYQSFIHFSSFHKCYDSGPWDFLNLIKHAKLVISGSFHALAFSIIFNIPFFAVNGDQDNRMSTILKNIGLLDRSIHLGNISQRCITAFEIDFNLSQEYLGFQAKQSISFLKKSLEVI